MLFRSLPPSLKLFQKVIFLLTLGATPPSMVTLYVGDLKKEVSEIHLKPLFEIYGRVASIKVCKDSKSGESLGYAYINFFNSHDAEKAMNCLNYSPIAGKTCRIMWSERDPTYRKMGIGNVIIKNISPYVDTRSIFNAFLIYGKIISCKLVTDEFGVSKGYGFIRYESNSQAELAVRNANKILFGGKKITTEKFLNKDERKDAQPVDPNAFTNVFIKNFPKAWKDLDLRERFTKFGEITSCVVQKDSNGESLCYGFCNFEKYEFALAAIKEMDNLEVEEGKKITVCKALTKLQRQAFLKIQYEKHRQEMYEKFKDRNLYVKNFNDKITDESLKELFNEFGEILSCKVMKDENKRSRCFGFVCFKNAKDAEEAIDKMNNKVIEGNPLYVAYAQPREERTKIMYQQIYNNGFRHAMMYQQGMSLGFPPGPFQNPHHFNGPSQYRPRILSRQNPQNMNFSRQEMSYPNNRNNSRFQFSVPMSETAQSLRDSLLNNTSNLQQKSDTNNSPSGKNNKIQEENSPISAVKNKMPEISEFDDAKNDFNNKIFRICQTVSTENKYEESMVTKAAGILIDMYSKITNSHNTVKDDEIREATEQAYKALLETTEKDANK